MPTPVTGTLVLVAPPGKTTDEGTLATAPSLELRLIDSPEAGAGPESVIAAFKIEPADTIRLDETKLTTAPTCTGAVAEL